VVTDGVVVETPPPIRWTSLPPTRSASRWRCKPGLPRFCGGLAGYFGYDAVRYIEKKAGASCPPDELQLPDILLLQCEELAVIDNLSGKLHLIVYADPASPKPTRGKRACAS
jgi:anthranilate synthase component 1